MKGTDRHSKLRRAMWELNKRRVFLQTQLQRPSKMIRGSLVEIWKRCSNKECHCYKKNEKHGPYYFLMEPSEGRHRTRHVRRKDWARVRERVERYRQFQKNMAEIRKTNEEIFSILKEMRDSHLERYD